MTAYADTAPRLALQRPGIGRLAGVELRKMVDTRAGFWLLATIGLLIAGITVIGVIWGEGPDQDLEGLFSSAIQITSLLLPVLGILAVTSEWSQRTGLATFSLVPERERVIAAKVVAAVALTVIAVAACVLAAAVGNVFSGGDWNLALGELGRGLLYELIGVLVGIAFGLLFLSSALAIVLYFVIPTAWAILGEAIAALDSVADWLDLGRTMMPLVEDSITGTEWAHLGVSVAFWVWALLAIGIVRLQRSELK
jgi:ABC-type transport system involved in multi-copper enzyme maturation permease subunit